MKDAVDSENSERVMEMSTFGYLYRVIAWKSSVFWKINYVAYWKLFAFTADDK